MTTPHRRIVLYGAGGTTIGHHILHALLRHNASSPSPNDQFSISVLLRHESTSTFPPSVNVIRLSPTPNTPTSQHAALVTALRNQDILISAIGISGKSSEPALVDAAIEAGVKWFFPSEFGLINTDPRARGLSEVFNAKGRVIELLQRKAAAHPDFHWTSVPTGLWLDWALDPGISFAMVDAKNRKVRVVEGGEYRLSFTTLRWAAEAVVAILLMGREAPRDRVRALEASQREIVGALERVQGGRYEVSGEVTGEELMREARGWVEGEDAVMRGRGVLQLIQVGFLTEGYGSNLKAEADEVQSLEVLGLEELALEDVVKEAVDRFGL